MHGMDWFGGGWFMMIAWWGLIIIGLVFGVKWIIDQSSNKKDNALDILKTRYAKGEINKEEYIEKKKELLN